MFHSRITARLEHQKREGIYRHQTIVSSREGRLIRIGSKEYLNFASNDYLGLSASVELKEAAARSFSRYGTTASSSRSVSGLSAGTVEAEQAFAEFFGYESALFLPSGYQGNIAIVPTLLEKGDDAFFDKRIHASLAKGLALSGAALHGYNHNDLKHLEQRLSSCTGTSKALITESLFSMDGDIPDMYEIARIKRDFHIMTIIDEAHAFGVIGEHGKGIARHAADIATGTLGKAFGLFGSFLLMPKTVREYMLNFSSPVIYSTALPEAHAITAMYALDLVAGSDIARDRCLGNSRILRNKCDRAGIRTRGDAQIIIIEIGDENRASAISAALRESNIFIPAIRFPTVARGRSILRASVTALHEEQDLERFVDALHRALTTTATMRIDDANSDESPVPSE